ncbi:PepSY-associated TM helix domain-containing protein [Sphingomonas sp. SRS2]|uniref:PepSY-associated TM helix domain-containing protein n=1 Tax=Sphingomonas sp. SRS2 TaxID=133190 RepID=UPI00061841F9|nr:PepSY-associated TM helix domain-containing protein [Sphingomonas sp. SRS2]KKC25889.1 membrane protein [Sphingomonas sp. SRS2]
MNQTPTPSSFAAKRKPTPKPWYRSRGWWLKQLHSWHWMSAAISLVGMMLFAATGITLNHAATIGATPAVQEYKAQLPAQLLRQLSASASEAAPLPAAVATDIRQSTGLDPTGKPGEWSDDEVYVAMPRPGGDAWVSIDRQSGAVSAELTRRGWISYVNDLHKGRNTGGAWSWFIDIFAGACILFTLTGLFLLYMHSKPRPLTWPLVGLGLLAPLMIILFLIH